MSVSQHVKMVDFVMLVFATVLMVYMKEVLVNYVSALGCIYFFGFSSNSLSCVNFGCFVKICMSKTPHRMNWTQYSSIYVKLCLSQFSVAFTSM